MRGVAVQEQLTYIHAYANTRTNEEDDHRVIACVALSRVLLLIIFMIVG